MKMSQIMTAVGYPSNLVREEQEREQDAAKPAIEYPCQTCQKKLGYPWSDRPEGPVIWCLNFKCADYHSVFTPEEWIERSGQLVAAHDADL